jgi:putative endonuclease
MNARIELGRAGEDAAAHMYERMGFRILSRNWRCPQGEIDLVARRRHLVVFCEVKTRAGDRFGLPAEAVSPQKQARLRRLAGAWLAGHRGAKEVRFDVVSVIVRSGELDITHVADAF